jgi:hypothetical protein
MTAQDRRDPSRSKPPTTGQKKQPHEAMADPTVHDGAARHPGGPPPPADRRQGDRGQKDSV